MKRRRARTAMTLLEVIIALTIAGGVLVAGASVLGFLTDQHSRAGGGAQAVASANAVRTALREWAAEARLTTEGDAVFRGVSTSRAMQDREKSSELVFVTSAPTPLGTTGTIVSIHMANGESDSLRGLIAELQPWRQVGPPTIVSLAPEATGFHARYLGSIHERPVWQKDWISTSVLPAAMELRIEFDTSRTRMAGPIDRATEALLSIPMTIILTGRR